MHLPVIVCRLHSYPLVLHFYRVLNTERYYEKTIVVWIINIFLKCKWRMKIEKKVRL